MSDRDLPASSKDAREFEIERVVVIKNEPAIGRGVHDRLELQRRGRRQGCGPGGNSRVIATIRRRQISSSAQLPKAGLIGGRDGQTIVKALLDGKRDGGGQNKDGKIIKPGNGIIGGHANEAGIRGRAKSKAEDLGTIEFEADRGSIRHNLEGLILVRGYL